MKMLIILLIVAGVGYYFFSPTINKMFERAENRYTSDVQTNRDLAK